MAHSYVSFRTRSMLLHDMDIEFLMGAIMKERNAVDENSTYLVNLMDWWNNSNSHSLSGCINLKLDENVNSLEEINFFIHILVIIKEELRDKSETLSPDYLNDLLLENSIKYQWGVSKNRFIEAIDKLLYILSSNQEFERHNT